MTRFLAPWASGVCSGLFVAGGVARREDYVGIGLLFLGLAVVLAVNDLRLSRRGR